jgi:hypothetical protein
VRRSKDADIVIVSHISTATIPVAWLAVNVVGLRG